MKSKFKLEVLADSSGDWAGNAVEYDTFGEARMAAIDLAGRWMLVTEARVVKCRVLSLDEDGKTDGIEVLDEKIVWGT